jgi:tetratricopeptide (TPR) repeat protein
MDALKKAELAKRQGQSGSGAAPLPGARSGGGELELAPIDGGVGNPPSGMQLDELHLEVLDDQFETPIASKFRNDLPRRTAAAATAPPSAEERAAARNVFETKQNKGAGKLFIVAVTALTLVAVAVIGIYFWLQLAQPSASLLAPGAQTAAVRPPAPAPAKPIAAAPATAAIAAADSKTKTDARTIRPRVQAPMPPLPSSDGEAPIRITTAKLQVNPALARAYDAFVAGDMAAAQREYEQMLAGDAKNGDALLGLAAVQLRKGQPSLAEDLYIRALEANPKNALAQASLISLHSQGDPLQAESHLQTLIAAQPDLPPLHFVLGNVYARQGRWNDAQHAYFKAYSGDSDNPDYLFNLAVSLDRIRQPKLAAQYYNQALAAAANRQASFDRAQVTARLQELQP